MPDAELELGVNARPATVRLCEPSIAVRTRLTASCVEMRFPPGPEAAEVDGPSPPSPAYVPSPRLCDSDAPVIIRPLV